MTEDVEDLLTPEDLAKIFTASRRRIMEWQLKYNWPCVKVGRTYRWTPEMVTQIKGMHSVKAAGKTSSDPRTKLSARRAS